jgi:hypothetical protein
VVLAMILVLIWKEHATGVMSSWIQPPLTACGNEPRLHRLRKLHSHALAALCEQVIGMYGKDLSSNFSQNTTVSRSRSGRVLEEMFRYWYIGRTLL